MLHSYCLETEKDWDENVALFFYLQYMMLCRSLLGLVFPRLCSITVCGPLKVLQEQLLSPATGHQEKSMLMYVPALHECLGVARDTALKQEL